ncbi:MAG TPA: spore maturation protein [Candidatus Limadaptatus stercorigallinarum]|uniref:Spore maturation protein n=1 Tax=Candidatus Limadaptatus stercorigallinarum TaxID=2840845 RepID=A0A9D1L2W6_9FIRM|nr:spore maturation protein [Candidatus Limadaptatus stercorigallinarum]
MTAYLLPVILIGNLVYAIIKKVNVYDCFLDGAKESLSLVKSIFPYVAVIFICIELFRASGLSAIVSGWLSYPLRFLGIPPEITELVLLVPLSGNGTIALLESIITEYGVDSYIARCAAAIAGASETIFYVSAVYFSKCKVKRLRYAIPVSLFGSFCGMVIACALCRVM